MSAETTCEMCGAPAYNCNGRGELIGRHTDIEECLSRLVARVAALEQADQMRQPVKVCTCNYGVSATAEAGVCPVHFPFSVPR